MRAGVNGPAGSAASVRLPAVGQDEVVGRVPQADGGRPAGRGKGEGPADRHHPA